MGFIAPKNAEEIRSQLVIINNDARLIKILKSRLRKKHKNVTKTLLTKFISYIMSIKQEVSIINKKMTDLEWRPIVRGGSFWRRPTPGFKPLFLDDFNKIDVNELASYTNLVLDLKLVDDISSLNKNSITALATCRNITYFTRCMSYNLESWKRLMKTSLDLISHDNLVEAYSDYKNAAHMIEQCEEKIRMYYIDLPLIVNTIKNKNILDTINIEKTHESKILINDIIIRKELTDLIRHILADLFEFGKKDKISTRKRLYDLIRSCSSYNENFYLEEILINLVTATYLKDEKLLNKTNKKLKEIRRMVDEDILVIIQKFINIIIQYVIQNKNKDNKQKIPQLSLDQFIV